MTPPALLVLAWGNLSRGDDALGPLFLAELQARLPTSVRDSAEFLEDYQLQIEHALDLAGRDRILFVDASLNCAPPFAVSTVLPRRDSSYSSHALSPQALLQVFVDHQGHMPPPATLLAIRGEAFGLGEPVTAAAQRHLAVALNWAVTWVTKPENSVMAP